jgi:hypothetical protein
MASCPNENLDSWKQLVASRGEDIAYYLWDLYDGEVPADVVSGATDPLKGGRVPNEMVDKFVDKVIEVDDNTILVPATETEKRHYTFNGKRVASSVTEKVKQKTTERTEFEQGQDTQKKDWGSDGHAFAEVTLKTDLLDEDGYAKEVFTKSAKASRLNSTIQTGIRSYLEELVRSYPPGTRFLVERKGTNTSVKGMISSTMDLIIVEPIRKADGTRDMRVDIFDWKFTNFNKSTNEDIPFYKQTEWKAQMGEYSKMLYSYGLKPEQLRRARMIPFYANYENKVRGDRKSPLILKSLEIGKVDNLKETKLYLLPVALDTETTGNKKVDDLVKSLRTQWEKLYKTPRTEEEYLAKKLKLNQLAKAIRYLQMKQDFAPLSIVGKNFLVDAKKTLDSFEAIDYSKLEQNEIAERLGQLIQLQKSAEKFSKIDSVYLSQVSKEDMTIEEQKILSSLKDVSKSTDAMLLKISELQKNFVVQYALKEGAVTKDNARTILNAELEIGFMAKTFLEGTKLSPRIIRLASNAILKAKSGVAIQTSKMVKTFEPLLLELEKEAATKGKSAFDLIGYVDGDTLSLIKKIDKEFWNELSKAKSTKDKDFLIQNMDVAKFNELAKAAIKKGEEDIDSTLFSTDEEMNDSIKEYRKKKLRDSIDINLKSFDGYEGYAFSSIYSKVLKEDEHLSKEYKEMSKNKAALDMWNFFTQLNQKGKEMGYLAKKGIAFFPLIEATMIDKLAQTNSVIGQGKDFFRDSYTVKETESQSYSRLDPETNKLKKEVPKFFTKTNKDVTQLSRDLTKIGPLWIKSLLEYQSSKDMEDMLLTMHSVEKAKGSIVVDAEGKIVFEAGSPKIDESSNKNADVLQTIIDDGLYGLNEDLTSIGNIGISTVSEKFSKGEEAAERKTVSVKKIFNNANSLTQSLAVGLKLLVAIPNYFGNQFQAYINSGGFYNFKDFQKNNLSVTTGAGLTTIDKALMDAIVPLNEDVAVEKQKELAKKQGVMKTLSAWSFTDVMMITNSFPERKIQYANAKSFNDNTMIENGKLVNIRQYLRAEDRKTKYAKDKSGKLIMSDAERRALENSFEDRVKALKETRSLPKVAKIENDELVIPGVSDQELAKYRVKIIEYGRNINGQMNLDNKAAYRRDTILKSFMMFKNWIPKQVSLRTLDIQKNMELDEWEYGRSRVFVKTLINLGFRNITKMRDIMAGTAEGLAIMDEILEDKRQEHLKKTGQVLEITNEEFYDLMRKELSNQMKELGVVIGVLGLLLAARAAVPDDEEDLLAQNRYKFWAKATNKIADEILFYYNPMSFEGMTKGSVLPSLSLLTKGERFLEALLKESAGTITDDEDLIKKGHPVKYFFDMIPFISQFQSEILPIVDPELAKELGIRVSAESRRQ